MKQESQEYVVKSVEIETKEVNRVIEIVRTAEFGQAVDILSKADKIVTSGSGGTGVAEEVRAFAFVYRAQRRVPLARGRDARRNGRGRRETQCSGLQGRQNGGAAAADRRMQKRRGKAH